MKVAIKPLPKKKIDTYLSIKDLTTDPDHAIGKMYEKIYHYLRTAHPTSDIRVYRPDPIVEAKDNYDRLLFAQDNVGRSSTYTHYVTSTLMLRTHTSAYIPNALEELAEENTWNDVIIVLPGLVYRRDVTDKKHLGIIHQMDIWRVVRTENVKLIGKNDLLQVVEGLAHLCAPDWKLRIIDSPHPYTKDGIEVNLVKEQQDIEILECGLINNQILLNAGLDPEKYSGWALGMGLDRLTMIHKAIPDIRYLRSTNPKIEAQMHDLLPYHEVSLQPAMKRDLSYCVQTEEVEEDINENIRIALGKDVDLLESVCVLNTATYAELPTHVREKLGCTQKLKNVLVRITLRHLSKTLTDKEANTIYDKIYAAVNKGKDVYK